VLGKTLQSVLSSLGSQGAMRMEASKDYGDEPVGKDLDELLLLVAACPFGLLGWVAVFFAIRWSVLAVWSAVIGMLPNLSS
jgi:hypothetical protein